MLYVNLGVNARLVNIGLDKELDCITTDASGGQLFAVPIIIGMPAVSLGRSHYMLFRYAL